MYYLVANEFVQILIHNGTIRRYHPGEKIHDEHNKLLKFNNFDAAFVWKWRMDLTKELKIVK
jgi:hypothetical protein